MLCQIKGVRKIDFLCQNKSRAISLGVHFDKWPDSAGRTLVSSIVGRHQIANANSQTAHQPLTFELALHQL
jgi:hypothetical protein